jgi:hypothetical protein
MWNEFFPISTPITAIVVPTCWDMAFSLRRNQDVPAIFNLIERAHTFDKCLGWHPNPIRTSGIDV